jgi:hypothetical protein
VPANGGVFHSRKRRLCRPTAPSPKTIPRIVPDSAGLSAGVVVVFADSLQRYVAINTALARMVLPGAHTHSLNGRVRRHPHDTTANRLPYRRCHHY